MLLWSSARRWRVLAHRWEHTPDRNIPVLTSVDPVTFHLTHRGALLEWRRRSNREAQRLARARDTIPGRRRLGLPDDVRCWFTYTIRRA